VPELEDLVDAVLGELQRVRRLEHRDQLRLDVLVRLDLVLVARAPTRLLRRLRADALVLGNSRGIDQAGETRLTNRKHTYIHTYIHSNSNKYQ
jgi:hypothetical protein